MAADAIYLTNGHIQICCSNLIPTMSQCGKNSSLGPKNSQYGYRATKKPPKPLTKVKWKKLRLGPNNSQSTSPRTIGPENKNYGGAYLKCPTCDCRGS